MACSSRPAPVTARICDEKEHETAGRNVVVRVQGPKRLQERVPVRNKLPIGCLTKSVDHVVIVIPAHNEQQRIPRALSSVSAAVREVGRRATCSIVVVADACSDRTAATASLLLEDRRDLVLRTRFGRAGEARRAGTVAGLARSSHSLSRTWIVSTDADSIVPLDWLTMHLEAAASGFDAIAGVVTLIDDNDLDDVLREQFAAYYELNPDGSHPHVHGANLGVRGDAYCAVGGWMPMATGEDHDLWNRLAEADYRLSSSSDLVVATSARRRARAPEGFAADLVALDSARGAA